MAPRYDKSTMEDICCRLRDGESLLSISRDPVMPSQRTLSDWVSKNRMGFAERYIEAKRVAAHFLAERALEEAYNDANDFYLDDSGKPVFDGHHVQRSKLIIDTIKWEASKMLPKLYGEKVTQELGFTGDLAKLIADASNRDQGLPKPIDANYEELSEPDTVVEALSLPDRERTAGQDHLLLVESPRKPENINFKNAPSTPSNHRQKRRRRQSETPELNQK